MLFSVYSQLLTGKNDVIVAIYDPNMEIDIAAVVTTRRAIVGFISLAYSSAYPEFIINLNAIEPKWCEHGRNTREAWG